MGVSNKLLLLLRLPAGQPTRRRFKAIGATGCNGIKHNRSRRGRAITGRTGRGRHIHK